MGNKGRSQKLRIQMKYVPAPDVGERVSRALGILLRAAARTATTSEESINAKKEEEPAREGSAEDTLTAGDGECKDKNERNPPDQ
jgi:hypothetical protein